jgi:60 kDa SS-A/Ro ribonucleoprotein
MPTKKSSSTNKAKKPSAAATAMAAQAAQSALVRAAVPQWFRLDPDQVQGNAGGFVWQISDQEQVLRYLIIGSEGGNYYQTPQQVSSQCASCVLRMTRTPANFKWLVDTIRQVSIEGRAAKQESTLLALATAIVFAPTPEAKTEALDAVKDCVRILTHMYMLIGYIKIFSKAGHPNLVSASSASSASASSAVVGSGLGRGIRRVFGEYFYSRTGIEIANLMTKYQNREGWTIKDVLTLIHIDPKKMKDDGGRLAIEWVFKTKEEFTEILKAKNAQNPSLGGGTPVKTLFDAIKEIHTIAERPLQHPSLAGSASTSASTSASNYQYSEELDRIVQLINTAGLCREQLPSQLFKYRKIWEALLLSKGANGKGKGMPLTALIRNLGKLSTAEIGIIDQAYNPGRTPSATFAAANTQWGGIHPTEYIIRRLTNAHDIKYSRVHPYNILVAMMTYKKGCGDKGSLNWIPNVHIINALDQAFKLAFQNVTPTGKRIKIALDVSGSMSSAFCTGSPIVNCATASVAMMMMTLWVERGVVPPPSSQSQWWTTTQLPDGRTLYENTKTKQCQFTPPTPPAPAPAPAPVVSGSTSPHQSSVAATLCSHRSAKAELDTAVGGRIPPEDYKKTKQYLGIPINPAAEAPRSATTGYYTYTPQPQHHYLPELYPPPATPTNVTICAFSNTIIDLTNAIVGYMDATIDPATGLPTMTIADALKLVDMPFSSTDCALPMIQALKNNEQVDAFVIYTDSETYMGTIHPQAALEEYRKATGIDAKLIVVGMTSNCLTIADPKDLNTLNLAGFDTATPRIISDFTQGGGLCPPPPTAGCSAGVPPPNGGAMLNKPVGGDEPPNSSGEEDQDEFVMLNPDE